MRGYGDDEKGEGGTGRCRDPRLSERQAEVGPGSVAEMDRPH
jgi:hypothetical protein